MMALTRQNRKGDSSTGCLPDQPTSSLSSYHEPASTVLKEWVRIGCVTGRVENAIRAAVSPGEPLATPSGRGRFTVARYTTDGLVLLLGQKEAWTPLPWRAMEEVPELLRGRGWVLIGSVYSVDAKVGSLDEHLKRFLKRATAGWVAALLEEAGVLSLDRSPPSRVKLRAGW